jgi:hypothetical protein
LAEVLVAEIVRCQSSTGGDQVRLGCDRIDQLEQVRPEDTCLISQDVDASADTLKLVCLGEVAEERKRCVATAGERVDARQIVWEHNRPASGEGGLAGQLDYGSSGRFGSWH